MRVPRVVAATILAVTICLAQEATAEIRFKCNAGNPNHECAFCVVHPDGSGQTNFVLAPGAGHGLNDNFAGGRYCVAVADKGRALCGWPNCPARPVKVGAEND